VRAARWPAEVRGPSEAVGLGVPEAGVSFLLGRAVDGAVVEHRVGEQLEDRSDLVALTGEERERGGQAPTGAGATYGNPIAIDARLLGEPGERVVAVMERDGEGMVGGHAVVDGGDDDAGLV